MKAINPIEASLNESAAAIKALIPLTLFIDKFAQAVIETFDSGNKVLIVRNGGGQRAPQHFAAELMVMEQQNCIPLPAIALTTDTSILTATGNDFDFDQIFARQVEALGKRGDMLLALSTSGKSRNVHRAVEVAKSLGLFTVALTGSTGSRLAQLAQLTIKVPHTATSRIQEAHMAILHAVCEVVENQKR